ncbi:hypothetical protein CXIVA_14030 [Clostridium sp. SY8519]|uniref:lysylphosphatidylglycerol synthase transmembrane domain-containing protein n=1 Tax=Clostridium sp. (strain SY8519) TaxID=1042156 RepID=UPI00021720DE|nr:lysylphosphatidylglycerol synthase transmembrane domain-containing protein [Clostridium sp. SY8519]BAK47369.1 hypothetical protein CXIVA_14030 [Clostridium sp. SY8519]
MKKHKKTIAKIIFLAVIILIIWRTFKDSAGSIVQEISETSLWVLIAVCVSSVIYHVFEAGMTYSLARRYNPEFRFYQALYCAFYCSFYRLSTLGSGTGVAAIYYLGKFDIEYSEAISLYMIQYVVHKLGVAIFSGILFAVSWQFMITNYSKYVWLLVLAYGVTVLICVGLVLLIMWKKFHELILNLIRRFNKNGRFDSLLMTLETDAEIMGTTAKKILKDRAQVLKLLVITLVKYIFWFDIPFLIVGGAGKVSFLHSLSVSSLAIMTAAVIPTPAGVGSSEFVMTLMYGPLVGIEQAGAVTILYRLATFIFPFLAGAALIIIRRLRLKKKGIREKKPSFLKAD